jgi:crossover junction endodeoxyribonuclease RusA
VDNGSRDEALLRLVLLARRASGGERRSERAAAHGGSWGRVIELRFLVPGPPQAKERPRKGKGGRFYTPARTRLYEAHVRAHARAATARSRWQRHPGAMYRVELAVIFPDARRRDIDNTAKAVLDACNGVAWEDDSQISELTVRREIDRERPRVEVVVHA